MPLPGPDLNEDNHHGSIPYYSIVRQALRSLHYGLHVLTSGLGSAGPAATITWVIQTSLRPRRMAIGIRKDSHIFPAAPSSTAPLH